MALVVGAAVFIIIIVALLRVKAVTKKHIT
jgi:hypothetical protein